MRRAGAAALTRMNSVKTVSGRDPIDEEGAHGTVGDPCIGASINGLSPGPRAETVCATISLEDFNEFELHR